MQIVAIASIGIITAISVLVLREAKPVMAVAASIAGGLIIMLMAVDMMTDFFSSIKELVEKTGVNSRLIGIIMKIIGVGYIAEFAATICDEAGTRATGEKIMIAGKVIIATLSLPIITSLIELITELLVV